MNPEILRFLQDLARYKFGPEPNRLGVQSRLEDPYRWMDLMSREYTQMMIPQFDKPPSGHVQRPRSIMGPDLRDRPWLKFQNPTPPPDEDLEDLFGRPERDSPDYYYPRPWEGYPPPKPGAPNLRWLFFNDPEQYAKWI